MFLMYKRSFIALCLCLACSATVEGRGALVHSFPQDCKALGRKGKKLFTKRYHSLLVSADRLFQMIKELAPPGVCQLRLFARRNQIEVRGTRAGQRSTARLFKRECSRGQRVDVYYLRHRSVTEPDLKVFLKRFSFLKIDVPTNAVVIRANARVISRTRALFRSIDIPKHQRFLRIAVSSLVLRGDTRRKYKRPAFSRRFGIGRSHIRRLVDAERITLQWSSLSKDRILLHIRQYLDTNQGPWQKDRSPGLRVRTRSFSLAIRRGTSVYLRLQEIKQLSHSDGLHFLLMSVQKRCAGSLKTRFVTSQGLCLKLALLR